MSDIPTLHSIRDLKGHGNWSLELAVLRRFAAINGWRYVRPYARETFSIYQLAGIRDRYAFSRLDYRGTLDHPRHFRRGGRMIAIVGQPYYPAVTDDDIAAVARDFGLVAHQPPVKCASIYYPGACRFIVYTRPWITVEWLPEQSDAMFKGSEPAKVA